MYNNKYPFLGLTLLLVSVIAVAFGSLCIGEIPLSPDRLLSVIGQPDSMEYSVLTQIRLPRILLAIAIGGSLSLSGVILQGIYRNPLVEPYTLGISGGASMGIALAIVTGLYAVHIFALPLAGFVGAFATIFVVYSLSMIRNRIEVGKMLLVGVMISFISSSFVLFLMSVTAVENINGIIFWTMGALNETNPMLIRTMLILSVSVLALSHLFCHPLNALQLGESKARHLGINTRLTIRILFVLTSLLTGACIAVGGVIGFVGLIIPHVSRLWFGSDYRVLLLASFLCGSLFLLLCDLVARTIISPNELPIGVITGIIGGIVFIALLSRKRPAVK